MIPIYNTIEELIEAIKEILLNSQGIPDKMYVSDTLYEELSINNPSVVALPISFTGEELENAINFCTVDFVQDENVITSNIQFNDVLNKVIEYSGKLPQCLIVKRDFVLAPVNTIPVRVTYLKNEPKIEPKEILENLLTEYVNEKFTIKPNGLVLLGGPELYKKCEFPDDMIPSTVYVNLEKTLVTLIYVPELKEEIRIAIVNHN